jgi:lipopolysaccharide biosynthesis glycosyltransferase
MKWYCAINEDGILRYGQMIAAGCRSALQETSLTPCLLYDGEENTFISLLRNEGVNIISGRVSFYEDLLSAKPGGGFSPKVASGAYLRLEIPNVETEEEYVLYTDVDVLFRKEILLEDTRPAIFAACPEIWTGGDRPAYVDAVFNSGVMVMNVPSFREEYERLVQFSRDNQFYFHGRAGFYDQGALNQFFAGRWTPLDKSLNCRPFIGDVENASILHFHGTKPYEIQHMTMRKFDSVPDTAQKLYKWAPDEYAAALQIYRRYIPEWWWDFADKNKGKAYGVTRESA